MAKFGDKLQPASHGFHVAAECREQKIAALFQTGNLVLTDAQRFRDALLGQLVRAAQFASDTSLAMSWAARRAIFLRRAGLMALIFWFKVFIGSLADAYVVPSKPTRPILRSPAGVSDGPDGHYGFLFRI